MSTAPRPVPPTVSLSLVSHTNVGKTTLARTLLGRDIGVVRDEAHVTDAAEAHVLLHADDGAQLLLWDTPGFGDSVRLARRLAQVGRPLGWLLTEVWDRWRDRAFWASQHAIRHVLGQADVALYLVNASEAPEDAAYLDAELQVMALLGKPVVALLNQIGPAGQPDEADLLARWQAHLARHAVVRAVLPLDAFTRCWVHEALLWQAVARLLPEAGGQRAAFAGLQAAWQRQQFSRWQGAVDELVQRLACAAHAVEPVSVTGWRDAVGGLRHLGHSAARSLGRLWSDPPDTTAGRTGVEPSADNRAPSAAQRAMARLAERLDVDLRASTERLIRLHGLEGQAGREVQDRLARHYALRAPVDEGRAALWGGLVTGALAGLKADLATGGWTLGGGLLVGGVVGALGAAGAARGVNRVRGVTQPLVAWDDAVLDALVDGALLAYLAVAHHGRGRGAWMAVDPPEAWLRAVAGVRSARQAALTALWAQREAALAVPSPAGGAASATQPPAGPAGVAVSPAWRAALAEVLSDACRALLVQLYPQASQAAGLDRLDGQNGLDGPGGATAAGASHGS